MDEGMKELLRKKLNTTVLIFLKNKYKYEGTLLNFCDDGININDKRDGETYLAISEISSIRGVSK